MDQEWARYFGSLVTNFTACLDALSLSASHAALAAQLSALVRAALLLLLAAFPRLCLMLLWCARS